MQKLSCSLKTATQIMTEFILNLRRQQCFKLKDLSKEFEIDNRRLSETCVILEAIRWVKLDGAGYKSGGIKWLYEQRGLLENELKTKSFSYKTGDRNRDLALVIIQKLHHGLVGSNLQIAQKVGNANFKQRVQEVTTILQQLKVIKSNLAGVFQINSDYFTLDFKQLYYQRSSPSRSNQIQNQFKQTNSQDEFLHNFLSQDIRANNIHPDVQFQNVQQEINHNPEIINQLNDLSIAYNSQVQSQQLL